MAPKREAEEERSRQSKRLKTKKEAEDRAEREREDEEEEFSGDDGSEDGGAVPVDADGKAYGSETLDAVLSMSKVGDLKALVPKAHPLSWYRKGRTVVVYDKMERGQEYELTAEPGELDDGFEPALTPAEMLEAGVFEGRYLNDCVLELPREWYEAALKAKKLSVARPNPAVNRFKIKSRQPLAVWRQKGWIMSDPRGFYQWYCRYWLGRRLGDEDKRQIGRYKNFARHAGQIKANCNKGDLDCRPKQRQALLQWGWNPYI